MVTEKEFGNKTTKEMKRKIHFEERPCPHIDGTVDESIKRLVLVDEMGEALLYDILDVDKGYACRLELMKLVLTHCFLNSRSFGDYVFASKEDLTRLEYVRNFNRIHLSSLVGFSEMLIVEDFYYGYKYFLDIMGKVIGEETGMSRAVRCKLATHIALGKVMFDRSGCDKAALRSVLDGGKEDSVWFGGIHMYFYGYNCYE